MAVYGRTWCNRFPLRKCWSRQRLLPRTWRSSSHCRSASAYRTFQHDLSHADCSVEQGSLIRISQPVRPVQNILSQNALHLRRLFEHGAVSRVLERVEALCGGP